MRRPHPDRRGYDQSRWPVSSDGNGNYLMGRRTTYVSLAILCSVVAGAVYSTRESTSLRASVDYSIEQTALSTAEIKEMRREQRDFERLISDSMGQLQTRIAVVESRLGRLESARAPPTVRDHADRR